MIIVDGEKSNLHDSIIWAMRFDDYLYFDMDLLIDSKEVNGRILNVISPATLVFYDVESFQISAESNWVNGFEIDHLEMKENNFGKDIRIRLQEGCISFVAKSYRFFYKAEVKHTIKNCLDEEERRGYNFDVG